MYVLTHSLILVSITFSHFFWAKVTLIDTTSCVHSVLSKSLFYSMQSVHTQYLPCSTHIWVSRWPLDNC